MRITIEIDQGAGSIAGTPSLAPPHTTTDAVRVQGLPQGVPVALPASEPASTATVLDAGVAPAAPDSQQEMAPPEGTVNMAGEIQTLDAGAAPTGPGERHRMSSGTTATTGEEATVVDAGAAPQRPQESQRGCG